MAEPIITCPNCKTDFKLNESLAAPLIESVKRDFEKRLTQQNIDTAKREQAINDREVALAKEKETVDQQVLEKLRLERSKIAAEELKKAKIALGNDLEQKAKEIVDLQEVLKARDEKLAEAQNAKAELIRKQRELDDAKREMELTIETRVQESLGKTREQAKKEAEEGRRRGGTETRRFGRKLQRRLAQTVGGGQSIFGRGCVPGKGLPRY